MGFTKQEMAATRRAALREAKERPAKGPMRGGDGRLAQRIPSKAYFNAIVNHGVDPNDTGYWEDMGRLYPETRVDYTPRTPVLFFGERGRPGLGRMTRFGRATFSKSYG